LAVIDFTIERAGYPTVVLNSDSGGAYGLQANSQGFGVGPIVPRFRESSGDGGQYVGDKVGAKSIDLGLVIQGADRLATGELIRALRNILRWRESQPFPRLVASYANGDIFEVPVVYSGGLEHDYSGALGETFRATVAVTAANPFWIARDAVQFAVQIAGGGTEPFLDDVSGLPVTSSNVLGQIEVTNLGDVACDLQISLTGPSSGDTTILVNGLGYTFTAALGVGEVVTISRGNLGVSVRDSSGANRYFDLDDAPKFAQLAQGLNVVDVSMAGATADSRITGNFRPRFEGIY
jgi:hypothetical protein